MYHLNTDRNIILNCISIFFLPPVFLLIKKIYIRASNGFSNLLHSTYNIIFLKETEEFLHK
jgi:hypothetical protein